MADNKLRRKGVNPTSINAKPQKMTKEQKAERSRLAYEKIQAPLEAMRIAQFSRPLVLHSKKGTRVSGHGHCGNCHAAATVLWKYAESTRGIVHLCSRCQPAVFSRSHGGRDAMSRAVSSSFESNRRKH